MFTVKSKIKFRNYLTVLSVSLLMIVLFTPSFAFMFDGVPSFVSAATNISVGSESALRSAVAGAPTSPYIIALTQDISLTNSPLNIPTGKSITLTSEQAGEMNCKLVGAEGQNAIGVYGVLTLDGVDVTCEGDSIGGVYVESGGELYLHNGVIYGHSYSGVSNKGVFEMSGGKISNNGGGMGGGVRNEGVFSMSGGVIANNAAIEGGGVLNSGNFTLSGDGVIANNTALSYGGGVYNMETRSINAGVVLVSTGNFSMSGGTISGNTADWGAGGVAAFSGSFVMSGGVISGNAANGGGVYISCGGGVDVGAGVSFVMSGGVITNNTATYDGGGVYVSNAGYAGSFVMEGGVIANNTATNNGGGVGVANGVFNALGGVIANNTASHGGGIDGNLEDIFVSDGVVFEGNLADEAVHNRKPADDALYKSHIGDNVVWTKPFTQGYNNYDIGYYGLPYVNYTVTVQGSYASVTGAGDYFVGDSVTVNAGSRSGYNFAGWTINEGGIGLANTATATFTMPDRNVTVTANWSSTTTGGGSNSGGGGGSSSTPKPPATSNPPATTPPPATLPPSATLPPDNGDDESSMWTPVTLALIAVSVVLAVSLVAVVLYFTGKNKKP